MDAASAAAATKVKKPKKTYRAGRKTSNTTSSSATATLLVESSDPKVGPAEKVHKLKVRKKKQLKGQLPSELAQCGTSSKGRPPEGPSEQKCAFVEGKVTIMKRQTSAAHSSDHEATTKALPDLVESPSPNNKKVWADWPDLKKADTKPKVVAVRNCEGAKKEPVPPKNSSVVPAVAKQNDASPEPVKEDALPWLAEELIFPLQKKNPRFPMAVYYCRLCSCHINTLKFAKSHVKTGVHSKAKEEYYFLELLYSVPWPPTETHYAALNGVFGQIVERHGRSSVEITHCFQLADWLTRYFKERLHPGCSVRLYGSSRTGFAVKSSNVNLELIYPAEFSHAWALMKACCLLANDTQLFSCVENDFEAKWPCVKFLATGVGFLPEAAIVCVLSACNGQAFDISLLLQTYASHFPLLVPLAQLCRTWAKVCLLDDAMLCGLPAYAFDLLLVHYLQQRQPPTLPIFHEIAPDLRGGTDAFHQFCVGSHNDAYSDINLPNADEWNLAELFLGFLKFYVMDFDHQSFVVNIRSSKPVTREEKDWRTRRFGIEDPFIPNKNVAQMTLQMYNYVLHCFSMTYKYFGIPQTIRGPLFECSENGRLVLGKIAQFSNQQSNCATVAANDTQIKVTGDSDNTAEIQKTLANMFLTMRKNETAETVEENLPKKESIAYQYERAELLHLHRDDYECNSKWTTNLDSDQRRPLVGLKHAKRVVEGKSALRRQKADVINGSNNSGNDDCGESSEMAMTYIPASTDQMTPPSSGAENQNEMEPLDYATVPVDSIDEETRSLPFSGRSSDRRVMMISESSEISSNGEEIVNRPIGAAVFALSDCVAEEGEDEERVVFEKLAGGLRGGAISLDDEHHDVLDSNIVNDSVNGVDKLRNDKTGSSELQHDRSDSPSTPEDDSLEINILRQKRRVVPPNPELVEAARNLIISDYAFTFSPSYFTDEQVPAIYCTFCHSVGHHSSVCPDKQLPPLVVLPHLSAPYRHTMNCFLRDLSGAYALTARRMQWQEVFRTDLERRLKEALRPDVHLSLFGSSCNGFGFVRSDLDLCLTFDGCVTLGEDEDQLNIIKSLAKVLRKDKDFRDVQPVLKAKVPIVRFYYFPSKLEGDISLYNCLALRNTELLRTYSLIDSRVRALGYIVKVFAKCCDIGDASRGSLSSYAYVLMMLHYLQRTQPPVIPVLQELGDYRGRRPYLVDGWDTYFFADQHALPHVWPGYGKNNQSLHELWLGFLRYYTEVFNAKTFVIQMRRTEQLSKFEKLWTDKPMAIEDPFDLNHNLASGLSWRMYIYIMKIFVQAREAFGHPRHEKLLASFCGHALTFEAMEKYFFERALRQKEPPPRDRLCKYCGHVGHFIGTCPLKKSKKTGAADKGKDEEEEEEDCKPSK